MKLPYGYRGVIGGVCSKHEGRYSINAPHLDAEMKLLVATDGHAIVVIPVTVEDGETSGPVPLKAIKTWVDGTKRNRSKKRPVTLHCGERVVVKGYDGEETSYPRSSLDFPKWKSQFDKVPIGKPTICLNASLLLAVQKALGGDFISLWIDTDKSAVYIGGQHAESGVALVMPAIASLASVPTLKSITGNKVVA